MILRGVLKVGWFLCCSCFGCIHQGCYISSGGLAGFKSLSSGDSWGGVPGVLSCKDLFRYYLSCYFCYSGVFRYVIQKWLWLLFAFSWQHCILECTDKIYTTPRHACPQYNQKELVNTCLFRVFHVWSRVKWVVYTVSFFRYSKQLCLWRASTEGVKETGVTKKQNKDPFSPLNTPVLIKISLGSFCNWLSKFLSTTGSLFYCSKVNI